LIVFLETEFSIDFTEIDFEQSQLDSIEAITNLIGAYRTQIGGP
jgi:acyl carrier protein